MSISINRYFKAGSLAAIVLGASALLNGAVAGEGPAQQVVKFGDLNLNNPAGVAVLSKRLHAAAEGVCQPFSGMDPGSFSRYRACVSESLARAVAQVNVPALTAYENAKSGKSWPRVASNQR